jgi:hypothetical protein
MSEDPVVNGQQLRIALEKIVNWEINPNIVLAAIGFGPFDYIEKLSDLLLKKIINNSIKHIPTFVGYLITMMIERCADTGEPPPQSLARLVRAYAGADRFGANEIRAQGFDQAALFFAAYPDAPQSEIAKIAGVSPVAVWAWFQNNDFEKYAEALRREIDPEILSMIPRD